MSLAGYIGRIGFLFILVGVVLVGLSILMMDIGLEGGGLLMIGPIPIFGGSSPEIMAFSGLIGVILVVLWFWFWSDYGWS